MKLRIVMIADTHGQHEQVIIPDGDVLIHAGDLTEGGTLRQLAAFDRFLSTLPHRHKIIIAGNHDLCFESHPSEARALVTHARYLQDDAYRIGDLTFWGSPWQPWFFDWAFNLPRGEALRKRWDLIPDETNVLITHGPPHGRLDLAQRGEHTGCEELWTALQRVRPRLHVFGHIHEGAGMIEQDGMILVNASICDARYRPMHSATVIDLEL